MTFGEFASIDSKYGALFTFNEYREIIQMINTKQFQPKIFKAIRRNGLEQTDSIEWNKNTVIKCFRSDGASPILYIVKRIETTTFTVNKPVALGIISFFQLVIVAHLEEIHKVK